MKTEWKISRTLFIHFKCDVIKKWWRHFSSLVLGTTIAPIFFFYCSMCSSNVIRGVGNPPPKIHFPKKPSWNRNYFFKSTSGNCFTAISTYEIKWLYTRIKHHLARFIVILYRFIFRWGQWHYWWTWVLAERSGFRKKEMLHSSEEGKWKDDQATC